MAGGEPSNSRLTELLAEKISITTTKITFRGSEPGTETATLIAGMCVGADSIDDLDLLRSRGMKKLFGNV